MNITEKIEALKIAIIEKYKGNATDGQSYIDLVEATASTNEEKLKFYQLLDMEVIPNELKVYKIDTDVNKPYMEKLKAAVTKEDKKSAILEILDNCDVSDPAVKDYLRSDEELKSIMLEIKEENNKHRKQTV
jgi:hypothetical protein